MKTHLNQQFLEEIKDFDFKLNEKIAPFTTYKVGGEADILVVTKSSEELKKLIQISIKNQVEYTILGKGADVLVSDEGVRGLVVVNKAENISLPNSVKVFEKNIQPITPRHQKADENFYDFEDLVFEENGEEIQVVFDSGVDLARAISFTIKNNLSGLQWFAGIPSTMGGALYNNVHGGTKHFSDYFYSAEVINSEGEVKTLFFEDFKFGYDSSILREEDGLVVLKVTLILKRLSDDLAKKAEFVAREWLKRKKDQPKKTSGCIFQNISKEDQDRLELPTPSVGYIVDKIFGLTGELEGGAKISEKHANFIENTGDAKAKDILSLINKIKTKAKKELDLELKEEINYLGF
jgi:UDP-N-acetylmuramate dehydrogenase